MTQVPASNLDGGRPQAGTILGRAPYRIGTVRLIVKDLDAVGRFYQEVVGLSPVGPEDDVLRLGVGSTTLIELQAKPQVRRRSPREAGLFHTAFLLPGREDLGAWLDHVARHRIPIQGASDHLVSEAVYLADPEGNGVEIYADRPDGAWARPGGAIEMSTDPLDLDDLLRAGAGRPWSGFPAGGTVGHVHLQVGDLESAEGFYRNILGFDLTCRYPGGSFFGSGGYHHQLAANVWNSRGAPPRSDDTTGLAGFEILARDASVLDALRGRLDQAGRDTSGDATETRVTDPWGIPVRVRLMPDR